MSVISVRMSSYWYLAIVLSALPLLGCKQPGDTQSSTLMEELGEQQESSFKDEAGTQLQYQYASPANNEQSQGLLILLHGSSRSSYDRFVEEMRSVAEQNKLIPVSVLAPNGQGWNERTDEDQVRAADALDALVREKLIKDFSVDTNRVFFSGQSSGGGFLASHFVPLKAVNFTGGAFFQCGQMPPQAEVRGDAEDHKRFAVHVKINSDDSWMDYYQRTEDQYRQLGFPFTSDTEGTGGHCNFDQAETISQALPAMEKAISKRPPPSEDRDTARPTGPRRTGPPQKNDKGEEILGT